MARVKIWTAPEILYGHLVAEALIERQIPVVTKYRWTGLVWYNPTPLEIWLEDEILLKDVEIRNAICEVIDGMPLTEQDSEHIASMPFHDVPEQPLFNIRKGLVPIVLLGAVLALGLLVYLIWRTTVLESQRF